MNNDDHSINNDYKCDSGGGRGRGRGGGAKKYHPSGASSTGRSAEVSIAVRSTEYCTCPVSPTRITIRWRAPVGPGNTGWSSSPGYASPVATPPSAISSPAGPFSLPFSPDSIRVLSHPTSPLRSRPAPGEDAPDAPDAPADAPADAPDAPDVPMCTCSCTGNGLIGYSRCRVRAGDAAYCATPSSCGQ
jgi:hypothetical protein